MKVEMEPQEIDSIAYKIVELLKPLLFSSRDEKRDEITREKNSPTAVEGFMGVEELTEYFTMSRSWIYNSVFSGKLPYFHVGRRLRFKRSDIDEWMASRRAKIRA
jgi:excisionase family DNA binding protein